MTQRLLYIVPVVAFLALVIAFYVNLNGPPPSEYSSMLIDKPAPSLALPALDTKAQSFAPTDLKSGHVTVVNFWSSWCVPCRVEGDGLQKIAGLKGVVVYGILYRDTPDKGRAFLDELGDPYSRIDLDRDGRAGIEWGITGVPETFVIDRQGIVRLRYAGPVVGDALANIVLPAVEKARAE